MSNLDRRNFLKVFGTGTAGLAGTSLLFPSLFENCAVAQSLPQIDHVLHVYLSGGMDGVNLVGPYGDDFKAVRGVLYPEPGTSAATLITNASGRDIYMHSMMNTFFLPAWNRGELMVLAGAGVPTRASGSHEVATRHIAAGVSDGNTNEFIPFEQRIAALNSAQFPNSLAYVDLSGGNTLSKPTAAYKCLSGSLQNFGFSSNIGTAENRFRLGSFFAANRPEGLSPAQHAAKENWSVVESTVTQVAQAIQSTTVSPTFPNTGPGRQMREAFIAFSQLGTRAAGVMHGGFDTHANQDVALPTRIGEVAAALEAFYQNMLRVNKWSRTVVVINSEFGRNIRTNASNGCDHGNAGVHFIIGGAVKGGLLGSEIFTTANINSNRNAWPVVNPVAAYYKAIGQGMGLDVSRAFPDFSGSALDLLRSV